MARFSNVLTTKRRHTTILLLTYSCKPLLHSLSLHHIRHSISVKYSMLNRRRQEYGLEPLTREWSNQYRCITLDTPYRSNTVFCTFSLVAALASPIPPYKSTCVSVSFFTLAASQAFQSRSSCLFIVGTAVWSG